MCPQRGAEGLRVGLGMIEVRSERQKLQGTTDMFAQTHRFV